MNTDFLWGMQGVSRRAKLLRRLVMLALLLAAGCTVPMPSPVPTPSSVGMAERTLASLEKVDDYPLYTMTYYGAYGSDETGEMLPAATSAWACSLFAALGDAEQRLYGRNFDWDHSPAVLLFTAPPDGYASVSMVDIAFLGFTGDRARKLDQLPLEERRPLLQAPYLPFDGMNVYGLVIGMAAVDNVEMPDMPDAPAIGSLGVIREMLDHAKTVDEAVEILRGYNVDMTGGPTIHYLIADATGKAALAEFNGGELHIIPNETSWHAATNFLNTAVDDPAGQCWRYDALAKRLTETGGSLTTQSALELLKAVSQNGTQWSIVYGITQGSVDVALGREYGQVYHFEVTP